MHWFQPMNRTANMLLLTHAHQNTLLTLQQTYERKKSTKIQIYSKSLIMGTESLLESPLGFQLLKHWDKLMASEFIIPLRNITAVSVINNLCLVVRAGAGHGFMCLLGTVGEDFSILFLKYPIHCQSQTLHISHFAVPHSVLSLEMQHDTSDFSIIKSMSGCRPFVRTLIFGSPLPPAKNHIAKLKPLQNL